MAGLRRLVLPGASPREREPSCSMTGEGGVSFRNWGGDGGERGLASVGAHVGEVDRLGVAGGRSGGAELGDGTARGGVEVQGEVDAVDDLVDGDVLAGAREEAVVGEGVEHRAGAAACGTLLASRATRDCGSAYCHADPQA